MQQQPSSIVRVPVASLVIDMALDDNNVAEKVMSMRNNGLIQPLTLWIDDLRVIDGFHRVAAADILGWQNIDAIIKDIDEEAFWDARIQSARQHADISNERLVQWVISCWKASEWPTKLNLSGVDPEHAKVLRSGQSRFEGKLTQALTDEHKQIAEALWLLRTDQVEPGDKEKLAGWFEEKAIKWSMSMRELERIVYGIVAIPQVNEDFDVVVASGGLTFDERNTLAQEAIRYKSSSPAHFGNKGHVAEFAKEYLEQAQKGETLQQFRWRRDDERKRNIKAAEQERNDIRVKIKRTTSYIEREVNKHYEELRAMGPEGAALLLNASNTLLDLAEKIYPGAKYGRQRDELAADNERLRNELREAQQTNEMLESQLKKRASLMGSVHSALVQHSSDISRSVD